MEVDNLGKLSKSTKIILIVIGLCIIAVNNYAAWIYAGALTIFTIIFDWQ